MPTSRNGRFMAMASTIATSHADRHRQQCVIESVVERFPEEGVGEHPLVVVQSDPQRLPEAGEAGEADTDRVVDRVRNKSQEAEDPRADEEQPGLQVPPVRLAPARLLGFGGRCSRLNRCRQLVLPVARRAGSQWRLPALSSCL